MTDFFAKVCDDAEKTAVAEWPLTMTELNRKAIELGVMHGVRTAMSAIAQLGLLDEQKLAEWMAQQPDAQHAQGQRQRYAYPNVVEHQGVWYVEATWQYGGRPFSEHVGQVKQFGAGWTAHTPSGAYVGLWPDQHEAAKALVKKAGYELGG